MDFGVSVNGNITDYLTLNGQNFSVALGANIDMNNQTIT